MPDSSGSTASCLSLCSRAAFAADDEFVWLKFRPVICIQLVGRHLRPLNRILSLSICRPLIHFGLSLVDWTRTGQSQLFVVVVVVSSDYQVRVRAQSKCGQLAEVLRRPDGHIFLRMRDMDSFGRSRGRARNQPEERISCCEGANNSPPNRRH